MNQSFQSGIFPDKLKIAKVISIFKKGNPELPSKYRPISLLPIFSKLFEKVMYKDCIDSSKYIKFFIHYNLDFKKTTQLIMLL